MMEYNGVMMVMDYDVAMVMMMTTMLIRMMVLMMIPVCCRELYDNVTMQYSRCRLASLSKAYTYINPRRMQL